MRRLFASLILMLVLTACGGEPGALGLNPTPNLRQQTATAQASIRVAANPQRSPSPTADPGAADATAVPTRTPQPTVNLAPITVTPLPSITPLPSATPEFTSTPEPTAPPEPTGTPEPTTTPSPPSARSGAILFNRDGAVWRYVVATGKENKILPSGSLFRAAPDGRRIAFVRDGQLFVAGADGAGEKALADNVTEAPAWAPDGSALAVVSGTRTDSYPLACGDDNRVLVISAQGGPAVEVGQGCQPAWAPDSKRLAYVTAQIGDINEGFNTLALVNREGENGWTPVSAPVNNGGFPDVRRIIYAPFWSADGLSLFAFGFVGYRALTDVSTLEKIDPVNGGTLPIGLAFDVQPGSVRPQRNGTQAAFTAAGAKGTTSVNVIGTDGVAQPFDYFTIPIQIENVATFGLEYASTPVWSPDNSIMAVVYCRASDAGCSPNDRAEIRLFASTTRLDTPLLRNVDPDSSLEWVR